MSSQKFSPSKWRFNKSPKYIAPVLMVALFGGVGIHFLTGSKADTISGGVVQLSLLPTPASVVQGQLVTVDVHLKTNTETVNAIQADFSYPANSLEYVSTTNPCVDPPFGITAENSGGTGQIKLSCGSVNGVNGEYSMGTVTFKALASSGSAALGFASNVSALRKNDNNNSLGSATGTTITLTQAVPTITSITPDNGSSTGGTPITITGSNFSGTTTVNLGQVAATNVTVVNPTTITAISTASTVGTVTVTVATNGQTATKTGAFSYKDLIAPTKPTTLSLSATETYRIGLSWAASTDTGGSGLTGYKVYRDGTLLTSTPVSATSYSDTTAQPATTYNYTVEAVDGSGNGSGQTAALNVTTRRKGDVNYDGSVNLVDLSRLLSKFNQSLPGANEDIDRDGRVGLSDLSILLSNYNK